MNATTENPIVESYLARARAADLTGVFCTSGSEREFTLEERWYAHETV